MVTILIVKPAFALVTDSALSKVAFVNDARNLVDFFNVTPAEAKAGIQAMQAEVTTLQAKQNLTSLEQMSLESDLVIAQILAITQKDRDQRQIPQDEALRLFSLEQQFCKISGQADTQTSLTESQYLALCLYTGDDYKQINGELIKSQGKPSTLKQVVATLDSALASLPDFTGNVWSGRTVDAATLASYSVGGIIQIDSYLSTSSTTPWAGNLQIVIHSKHGRDIHKFSRVPGENEVLMPRGSRFQIESISALAPGQTRIVLQQL